MEALPWVTPVYKRDLTIEKYFGGYLKHPYISFYTGRGCKSRCTFCLWPQTVGGHRYRVRSVENVVGEMQWAKSAFPQVKEFFFDDDTLTDNLPRVEALAKELGRLGVTWSCNAKANVPRKALEIMKDNGLRLLLVGYESGTQQILINIQEGMRVGFAAVSPRIVTNSASSSMGPSFSVCRRDRKPIQQTASPRRSIPHDSDFARGPYPAPSCTARRRKTAGSSTKKSISDAGRHADRAAELSAPESRRDLQLRRGLLPEILFPPLEDRLHRRGNDRKSEMMKRRLREGVEFFRFCGRGGTLREAIDRYGG
jgi:hypothetical protein